MKKHPALEIFTDLLAPSLSGSETRVANLIRQRIDDLGYEHETDLAGNVRVSILGKDPNLSKFVFAAHMDEIGMVVSHIEADGKLRVNRSGGLHPWKLGEGPVNILGDKTTIQGVLSMGSTHTPNAAEQSVTWENVHILTGFTPQELQSSGVRPGVPVLPTRERRGPVVFGPQDNPLVGAWTFDDRMGCVILLRLLESIKGTGIQPQHSTIIAFTTREEVGSHGAKYLARSLDPEAFVAIDGCPMLPGLPLELDGRPGIWAKDRIAPYDQNLLRAFSEAAITAGTELQPVVYGWNASDASAVSYSLGVPKIVCLGHVRENSHGFEVARLAVFDNLLNTLIAFLQTYQPIAA